MKKNKEKGVGKAVKRELVRAVLERVQGVDLNRMMADADANRTVYDDIEEQLNIPYVNRDEVPLAMDVFKPKVPEGTELPVIIIVHGGGLIMGDRGFSRPYSRMLAHKKYLVFSLEYRLAPRANLCMQLDDLCAGMDLVGRMLVDYDVNFTRIFMVADSAGAFLSAYVTSMNGSEKLQNAIGHKASRMKFAALGLMSGMFYTDRKDPIGWMLSEQIYGEKRMDDNFRQYMDPEHPEIIENLPPAFLITSRGDFLNNYTLMFHDALKKAGKPTHLLYFGDENLRHTFAISDPEHPKSIEATDKMLAWFEAQAKEKLARQKKDPAVEKKRKRLEKRIADGSINNQKIWANIKERRSAEPKLLQRTALIDCTREYTYGQMFEEWDRYARVFSGLGICAQNGSRAALCGAITAEPLFAFYALNMTGAVVSMLSYTDFLVGESWKTALEEEKITDLIVSDIVVTPQLWPEIEKAKEELGLRNVILLHSRMGGPAVGGAELMFNEVNAQLLKRIPGVVFIDDLFGKFGDTPIRLDKSKGGELAVITHDSGSTEGEDKPLSYTDTEFNAAADQLPGGFRSFTETSTKEMPLRIALPFDFSSDMSLIGLVNGSLAMGETIVLTFFGAAHPKFIRAIKYYDVDILAAGDYMIDEWLKRTDLDGIDLSPLQFVGLSGACLSNEKLEQYGAFFKNHGYRSGFACEAMASKDGKPADIWLEFVNRLGGIPAESRPDGMEQRPACNVFALFNAAPLNKTPDELLPFPLPKALKKRLPLGKGAEQEKAAKQMPENVVRFGNQMIGRMFGSKSIYVDFED